jgi:hypothetical protein
MPLRRCVLLSATGFLGVVCISIVWRFLTIKYPTHSDVFIIGVEAGVLAILLLVYMSLTGYFLYRLAVLPPKRKLT